MVLSPVLDDLETDECVGFPGSNLEMGFEVYNDIGSPFLGFGGEDDFVNLEIK